LLYFLCCVNFGWSRSVSASNRLWMFSPEEEKRTQKCNETERYRNELRRIDWMESGHIADRGWFLHIWPSKGASPRAGRTPGIMIDSSVKWRNR
jgi:hypothetical protein